MTHMQIGHTLFLNYFKTQRTSWDAGSKARQTRIEHWISSLSDDKLMRLYALLGEAYSRRGSDYKPYSDLKIIGVAAAEGGDVHVRAQDVYLLPVGDINPPSGIRYVKPEVYWSYQKSRLKRLKEWGSNVAPDLIEDFLAFLNVSGGSKKPSAKTKPLICTSCGGTMVFDNAISDVRCQKCGQIGLNS